MVTKLKSIIKVETGNSNKLFLNYFICFNLFWILFYTFMFVSQKGIYLNICKIQLLFLFLLLLPLRVIVQKFGKQPFLKWMICIIYLFYITINVYLINNETVNILMIFSINILGIIYLRKKLLIFTSVLSTLAVVCYYVLGTHLSALNIIVFVFLCIGLYLGLDRILKIFEFLTEDSYNPFIDPLTGAFNKHYLEERLNNIPVRGALELSIISINIDHMKDINNNYGTTAGDAILQDLINTLKVTTRESDSICRVEGDEFVIILQHPKEFEAVNLANRIKNKLDSSKIAVVTKNNKTEYIELSVSQGVSTLKQGENSDVLLERSQKALKLAKRKGRNRVEVSE